MTMPKISVIVPIYNVAPFLNDCLNSIANQTMIEETEVILVDDGSSDESKYIVDEYVLDYENFRGFHKVNGGLGNTRNFGLKYAKGEYIYFMDSDDYLAHDSLEKLYNMAKKYDHDIVSAKFIRFDDRSTWLAETMDMIFQGIDRDIENTEFKNYPNLAWDVGVWNKIFKREFIEKHNLRFAEKGLHEDNIFVIPAYYLSDSIGFINDYVYFWRARKNSLTQQDAKIEHIGDRVRMMKDVLGFMQSNIEEENIKKMIFHKILNMDFYWESYNMIKQKLFEGKEIDDLIKLIDCIPDESINDLLTYRRLMLIMLQNKDFDGMSNIHNNYSRLIDISEQELLDNLDEKYIRYVNTQHDLEIAKLTAGLSEFEYDDEKITFHINISRPFCPKHNFKSKAKLVRRDESIDLEMIDNEKIILPLNLINEENSRIKIEYYFNDIYKETYVENRNKYALTFDDFEIIINTGMNIGLNISRREKNQNNIIINDIAYKPDSMILTGKCDEPMALFIENNIDFERFDLETEFKSSGKFISKIRYSDLVSRPVKKWTLNADIFNNIKLAKNDRTIYFEKYSVNFKNEFSTVSVICRQYDITNTINLLDNKLYTVQKRNDDLLSKNRKISSLNKKLKKTIKEYKSRKIVRFADKIRKIFRLKR